MPVRHAAMLAVLALSSLLVTVAVSEAKPSPKGNALIKRGAYLVRIAGCGDCHTPMIIDKELNMPVPDMSRQMSGHPANAGDPGGSLGTGDQALIGATFTAFKQPFGVVYSANISPDGETGIGRWTEQQFIATLRAGKHLGTGRQILPPMPWLDFSAITDADLKAIFAYLKSLPPISNAVPQPKVDPQAMAGITESFDKLRARLNGTAHSGKQPE